MDVADRALLEETVRDAVARAAEREESADGALAELGWLDMLDSEPRHAVDVVFTALGALDANATVLDDVVVSALGIEPRRELAVLLPPFGSWSPVAKGLTTARVATAKELLVVAGDAIATVPIEATTVTRAGGIDPAAAYHVVEVRLDDTLTTPVDPAVWDSAVAAARRAIAHQILGTTRTMLALAREHALDRVQFDRPIVRFQAVRHRLAEAFVAVESIDAALGAAWDEPVPITAALAKAIAGRSAKTVATHCQQVLAGIGFTTDHSFHHYLKRTMALDGLFGRGDDLATDIGRELLASRTVPNLIEL